MMNLEENSQHLKKPASSKDLKVLKLPDISDCYASREQEPQEDVVLQNDSASQLCAAINARLDLW